MVNYSHDRIKPCFITAGDPNLYDGTKALRKELRARLKDTDRDGEGLRQVFAADDSLKVNEMHQDEIADFLSDAAPAGLVFEIRTDINGNSNYGYFTCLTR